VLAGSHTIAFVATTQPTAARAFYQDVLGLPLREVDAYAAVFDVPGGLLRLVSVPAFEPAGFTIFGWLVDDIVAELGHLVARGVQPRRFDGFQQDQHGVWTAPGGARVAWFTDPDGNTLSLTQLASA
jgi:catechol 2,3-dioxygenase-like lactoylglutathione lyase family enzyme